MKLLITAPAYYPDTSQLPLVLSAKRLGIPLETYGDGAPQYAGWIKSHVDDLLAFLQQRTGEYDTVLFSDASDAFFCAPLAEIEAKARHCAWGLTLATERDCYPDGSLAHHFFDQGTPWRYPNGGGFCGSIDKAIRALRLLQGYHSGNPQLRWHQAFAESNLQYLLDYGCLIFQTMSGNAGDVVMDGGRPRNTLTGAYPCVVHFNGDHKWEEWYGRMFP
jgi:hypothetical protein